MLVKGLLIIFLFIFVVTASSFACSIQVDDNYDKNILVAPNSSIKTGTRNYFHLPQINRIRKCLI